jgi:hypothetical protein
MSLDPSLPQTRTIPAMTEAIAPSHEAALRSFSQYRPAISQSCIHRPQSGEQSRDLDQQVREGDLSWLSL